MSKHKTKKERGLCDAWGCHAQATVYTENEMGCRFQLCEVHWNAPGPLDLPSFAEILARGETHYWIVEVK